MGTEIVNWEEKLANDAKEIAAMERPALTSISLRSGMMSINSTPIPGNKLPCVVVASVVEHQYFDKPFDPNVKENPVCFALSSSRDDISPHPSIENPQSPGTCAECPKFAWGSDPKGGKGKACKEKRRLALLPASAIKDGEILKAEMAVMTLPVTSVRNWGSYVNQIAAEYGRPPWAILTEISVAPHVKNQFEVKFNALGVVADQFLGPVNQRIEGALDVLLAPYEQTAEPEAPTKQNTKY